MQIASNASTSYVNLSFSLFGQSVPKVDSFVKECILTRLTSGGSPVRRREPLERLLLLLAMPWTAARVVDLDPSVTQSLLPNNLACDGDGRFAFVHGSRVQCTRRVFSSAGRCDFTLAYSEDLDVTGVYWWKGVTKYGKPLLVLTTDSSDKSPPTVQVWNAWRGTGSRVFKSNFKNSDTCARGSLEPSDEKPLRFVRGVSQASSSPSGQLLFCGANTGSVFGIVCREGRGGGFEHICTLNDLCEPIAVLGADKAGGDLLAAADEGGNLIVWRIEEDLDYEGDDEECVSDKNRSAQNGSGFAGGYTWDVVYRHKMEADFICSIGVRQNVIVAGHASGTVTFHDTDSGMITASAVTNTTMITGIDVYPGRDLVLVCGEDCRTTVLGFARTRGHKPVVHFSLALNAMVTGCSFTTTKDGFPGVALLLWDKSEIARFEYHRSSGSRSRRLLRNGGDSNASSSAAARFPRQVTGEDCLSLSNFSLRRPSLSFSRDSRSSNGSSRGDGASIRSTSPPPLMQAAIESPISTPRSTYRPFSGREGPWSP